ncbi:MAG: tRNA lysidine(34) synthetase TilS [Actinomycetota bacterium]
MDGPSPPASDIVHVVGPEHAAFVADLLDRCNFGSDPTVCCAVSGGPDSIALMILARASGAEVRAVHVDHGLRPESAADTEVVAAAATRFGARWESVAVDVEPGPNLEARARSARYAALPAGVATGHTADDQAETMLLALIRGSAWEGLGAMTPSPRRPLLGLRRSETHELCARLGVATVEDPSNTDPTHRRNRVRHELLPLLDDIAERDLVSVLVRQAELFRQGGAVIEAAAVSLDPLDARGLADAPEILARSAVRRWLWAETGWDHPPDLAAVDRVLAVARLDAEATDVGRGWRVRRSAQRLHLEPPASE